MAPDVDFTLTEENFKVHEKLLDDQGVKVFPKSRETVEDLEKGGISHVCTSGILVFRECEFIYHMFQNAKGYRLNVEAFSHSSGLGDGLVAAIKCMFPQTFPPSALNLPSRSVPARKLDKSQIVNGISCIGMLLLFCAACFFAAMGIRSFFK
jgi:hypothetical protein